MRATRGRSKRTINTQTRLYVFALRPSGIGGNVMGYGVLYMRLCSRILVKGETNRSLYSQESRAFMILAFLAHTQRYSIMIYKHFPVCQQGDVVYTLYTNRTAHYQITHTAQYNCAIGMRVLCSRIADCELCCETTERHTR